MRLPLYLAPLALSAAPLTAQVQLIEVADGGSSLFGFGSFATCLNADGTVVCGRGGAGWGYDYRWEEGVGATQLLAAGVSTSVVAVSADGSLAFGRGNDPASGFTAVRVDASGAYTFLDRPPGAGSTRVQHCRDDGLQLFGRADGVGLVVWQPDGTIEPLTFSPAAGFGSVAGDGTAATLGRYVWTDTTGTLPSPVLPAVGRAMDASGSVAFCADSTGPSYRYELATGDVEALGDVPGPTFGAAFALVSDCDSTGDVAVGRWVAPAPGGGTVVSPALWHREFGAIDLRSYATELGADLTGWGVNLYSSHVSADASTVACYGVAPDLHSKTFLLRFPQNWWTSVGESYCAPAVPNSTGDSAHIAALGSASVGDNALRLEVHGLPPNQFGFVVSSRTQGFTPAAGGSMGNLCVGGAIGRHTAPGEVVNSGAFERALVEVDLSSIPTPTTFVAAQPGETWHFQFWHRDVVGGAQTSNYSDAVSVTVGS
ncbi:MAG: hypothetical protein AAFU73_04195 [Planctomycetota bacterium]